MSAMDWWKTLLKAMWMDVYNLFFKFMSRKLLFSMFSIFSIIYCVSQASKSGLPDNVLMISIPIVVTAITVICVTFVTGLAKIDIQAAASLKVEK